jgi:hypothetical protein
LSGSPKLPCSLFEELRLTDQDRPMSHLSLPPHARRPTAAGYPLRYSGCSDTYRR